MWRLTCTTNNFILNSKLTFIFAFFFGVVANKCESVSLPITQFAIFCQHFAENYIVWSRALSSISVHYGTLNRREASPKIFNETADKTLSINASCLRPTMICDRVPCTIYQNTHHLYYQRAVGHLVSKLFIPMLLNRFGSSSVTRISIFSTTKTTSTDKHQLNKFASTLPCLK